LISPGAALADMAHPGFGVAALVEETEELLRGGLGLAPLPIAPELARAEGSFRGGRVVIETRAYSSAAARYARFVNIAGPGLEIGNVLVLGRPPSPLPIFGADLVSISADAVMIAVDLSPALRDSAPLLAPLASRRARHPELLPGGELPGWCSAWFSPFALYTRVPPAVYPAARAAYLDFAAALLEIEALSRSAGFPGADAAAVAEAQAGYLADHRTQDKGLTMLAKMFGAAWASRYIEAVLFPSVVPAPAPEAVSRR
jgi:phycocyanobilin:ferredoxin oxidoreductase